ncbi:MAG: hypothetical protein ACRDTD_28450, partial [Pseudonocardiaceae bacterium]
LVDEFPQVRVHTGPVDPWEARVGAGTGSLISSLGAICSALASATMSESLSSATSPRSIRSSCDFSQPRDHHQ